MQTSNKSDIVEQAMFKATMIGSLIQADTLTTKRAGVMLEMMMPSLEAKGIRVGWMSDENRFNPQVDAESGLPDWTIDSITSMLANKLYMSVSGQPRADLMAQSHSLESLLYPTDLIQRERNEYQPMGSGASPGAMSPQYQTKEDRITIEQDGVLEDLSDFDDWE
jgi:hypothetical protein